MKVYLVIALFFAMIFQCHAAPSGFTTEGPEGTATETTVDFGGDDKGSFGDSVLDVLTVIGDTITAPFLLIYLYLGHLFA